MSKKRNKQFINRSTRRVLNEAIDFFGKLSGRKINRHGWGCGVSRGEINDKTKDNDGE